ncbi:MAG: 4Fe-4S dicluster domain-containing protein [Eggerthellaceae bacterium]|nr:4Fe-4S dicluster domain-containing protein [Eggerthellaceae bacterium]
MMTIEERLALDKYEVDEESHIALDQAACAQCLHKYCLTVCPAKVYTQSEGQDAISVSHVACLECGTCIVACQGGGLTWNYPTGSMGVVYRYA